MASTTQKSTKSARRALEILDFFASEHRPASVMEVAEALGYPQSSTSALLDEMVRQGYLLRNDGDRRFRPSMRVMFLGAWVQDALLGQGNLMAIMQDLRMRTRCTVIIAAERGGHAQYLMALRRTGLNYNMRAGMLRPICHTALGKALLMDKPARDVDLILRRANAETADPALQIDPAAFREEMKTSKARGWAMSSGRISPGLSTIAMPLPPLADYPPVSLGVGGPVNHLHLHRDAIITELKNVRETLEVT